MRSMVEGAAESSMSAAVPSTAYRRSPSPAARWRIPDCAVGEGPVRPPSYLFAATGWPFSQVTSRSFSGTTDKLIFPEPICSSRACARYTSELLAWS